MLSNVVDDHNILNTYNWSNWIKLNGLFSKTFKWKLNKYQQLMHFNVFEQCRPSSSIFPRVQMEKLDQLTHNDCLSLGPCGNFQHGQKCYDNPMFCSNNISNEIQWLYFESVDFRRFIFFELERVITTCRPYPVFSDSTLAHVTLVLLVHIHSTFNNFLPAYIKNVSAC